jgi:microcompartment protein CcmK/EutM
MRCTKRSWPRRARNNSQRRRANAHVSRAAISVGFNEEKSALFLGRVIGNVVATMKNDSLVGQRLLIVQPIDRHGRDTGKTLVALDSVGAGAGETIYWCRGKEASFPFLPVEVPTEATIVGIVDAINIPSSDAKA